MAVFCGFWYLESVARTLDRQQAPAGDRSWSRSRSRRWRSRSLPEPELEQPEREPEQPELEPVEQPDREPRTANHGPRTTVQPVSFKHHAAGGRRGIN